MQRLTPSSKESPEGRHHLGYGLAVGASLGMAYAFGNTPFLYPLKLLVTLFHEFGHAVCAYAVLGTVERIEIDALGAGVTYWRGGAFGGLGRFVVASGGYLGSVVSGALLIELNSHVRIRRFLLPAMIAWLGAVAVFFWGGLFTFAACTGLGLALYLVQRYLGEKVSGFLITFIGVFSATYALRDIVELITYRGPYHFVGGVSRTDAHTLQALTGIPAVVWAGLWLLIAAFVLWIVFRRVFRRAAQAAGFSSSVDSAGGVP